MHLSIKDTREKAIRDQPWALNAVREKGLEEGKIKGEVKLIQTLQDILGVPMSDAVSLEGRSLAQVQELAAELRSQVQRRS